MEAIAIVDASGIERPEHPKRHEHTGQRCPKRNDPNDESVITRHESRQERSSKW
jgi:hypothetical protein